MAMTSEQASEAGKKSSRENSPNKRTIQWEIFTAYCLDGGLKKFKRELTKLEGKAYVDAYLSLLEFHQPKLQRSEIKATIEGEIVTTTYTIGQIDGKPIEIEI